MNLDVKVPACSCGLSGQGDRLHADDCKRLIALIEKYQPAGRSIVKGKVVRS